jgi:hypothetical protein
MFNGKFVLFETGAENCGWITGNTVVDLSIAEPYSFKGGPRWDKALYRPRIQIAASAIVAQKRQFLKVQRSKCLSSPPKIPAYL